MDFNQNEIRIFLLNVWIAITNCTYFEFSFDLDARIYYLKPKHQLTDLSAVGLSISTHTYAQRCMGMSVYLHLFVYAS